MAYKYVKRTSSKATKRKGTSYKAVGKKPKLGSGKRFSALKSALKKKGVKNSGALAAWIGRKKYGKKKFQSLSVKGRKKK